LRLYFAGRHGAEASRISHLRLQRWFMVFQ
jgi:hypothetical protein